MQIINILHKKQKENNNRYDTNPNNTNPNKHKLHDINNNRKPTHT